MSNTPTSDGQHKTSTEKSRLLRAALPPLVLTVVLWLVMLAQWWFGPDLYEWGIFPRTINGLKGILFSVGIHADLTHLLSNTFPLLVLGTALFYFYSGIGWRVILLSVLITGFWVWMMARPNFHIGASGLVYSLAGFVFFSGMIRRHPGLIAISLLTAFTYGGLFWGIFPLKAGVSWESHLMGMVCGFLLAWHFRDRGPQRKLYSWDLEDGEDDLESDSESDSDGPSGGKPIMEEEKPNWPYGGGNVSDATFHIAL